MTAPLVSAIMPVYNGQTFLRAALDSILIQSYPNVEIIVVDDGSSDGSPGILREYGERIHLVQEGRGGSASIARRVGIARARGAYLAFLDADDTWTPDKLATQVALMESRPDVGLSFGNLQLLRDETLVHGDLYAARPNLRPSADFESLFAGNSIFMPTPMVKRAVYDAVGGFDPRVVGSEDYLLWMKIALVSNVAFIPEILGAYRLHSANTSRDHVLMLVGEFNALSLLSDEYADVRRRLGRHRVSARLADQAYRVAYRLRLDGKLDGAAEWAWRAALSNPTSLTGWLVWAKYVLTRWGFVTPPGAPGPGGSDAGGGAAKRTGIVGD